MIPYRLKFAGIRDFEPTLMDLSGDEHIMITGPNGSGKSTISFCMGAVLYSSKVDVEGLKSRNLRPDQVWRAHISLLFRNAGQMKIDEPEFIEFTLHIEQEPGQPIKKEFIVEKGETIDEWQGKTTYTSGDQYHNFSAYKKALQYRYKIDSDLFYLIWYQQEVNQFAVMHPEERFRIFSEMHGIDQARKNWEESMEKVKETEETLLAAENHVKLNKQNLGILKTALDVFLDNQRRLKEGAEKAIHSLLHLELFYQKEIETVNSVIEDLSEQLDDFRDQYASSSTQKEEQEEAIKSLATTLEKREEALKALEQRIKVEYTRLKSITDEKNGLEEELESLTEKQKTISRTEEEARSAQAELLKELKHTEQKKSEIDYSVQEINHKLNELSEELGKLHYFIEEAERLEKIHLEKLEQFHSSHHVQTTIDQLGKAIHQNGDLLHETNAAIKQLRKEELSLKEDRNVSQRQQQSLDYFRTIGIAAYPLRELLELDSTAKLKDENRFNAIKYAVFFNGKHAQPPNDLYHVPLMDIVPDTFEEHVPELHLKIKAGLTEEQIRFAAKALYWTKQFFTGTKPRIENGFLIDQSGIRGPQEKAGYILSQRARQIRLQQVQQELGQLESKAKMLEQKIQSDTEQFQFLNSEIQKVKEAEAFMTQKHERAQKKQKLAEATAAQSRFRQELIQLDQRRNHIVEKQTEFNHELKQVVQELEFYRELGKRKEKFDQLRELARQEKEKRKEIKTLNASREELEFQLDEQESRIKNQERKLRAIINRLEDINRNIDSTLLQQNRKKERLETCQAELVIVMQQLQEIQNLVPDLYAVFSSSFERLAELSETTLKTQLSNAMITFDNARHQEGIDPAAEDNYKKAKEEYERLEKEYQESKILLEHNKQRTAALKENLETTINMRVLEINKRFAVYMAAFQFQGEITWAQREDKNRRTHFDLYIKARKEGHRGTMEDVSVKARGGRVGKGVSGGEESLSSLLFALALLQNLETTPGFIVLDEFDSALDEQRKSKVFDLYVEQLHRKLIILTPKSHEDEYINRFKKAFVVQHDPAIPKSKVTGIRLK